MAVAPKKVHRLPEPATGEMLGRYEGLPYIGPRVDVKEDDPLWRQPVINTKARAVVLDLSAADDLAAYNDIYQQVADGYAVVSDEDRQYNQASGRFDVMLRWVQQYYTAPVDPRKGD